MGDPKRRKPKAEAPRKVWDSERIKQESTLRNEYGLRRTRELWSALSELKKMRRNARKLLSLGEEGELRGQKLVGKLKRLGIAKSEMELDSILALSVRDFLERRLQTVVLRKGLARTAKQARQIIVHGFISVNGRRVNIPSYMVTGVEEPTVSYFKAIDISVDKPEEKKPEISSPHEKQPEQEAAAKPQKASEE
ncbi:MAG: 30S ribosomal protein S4 [Candidatus Micrarchaeota archaeon]